VSKKEIPHVFAADLGGTKCSAAVVDRQGRIIRHRTVPTDLSSPSAPVRQICGLAEDLAEGRSSKQAFAAAAIAVPGLVRRNGTVWAPNIPGWQKMPVAARLRRLLGIPVVAESDRIAAVLGECWRGAGRGKSDVILLMIGTGIGAGILSGGRVVRGAHELSGCAGWLTITRDEVIGASQKGELECLAAGPAIARLAQERVQNGEHSSLSQLQIERITAHEVATAARQGDKVALAVFEQAGRSLGFAIANLVSVLDPELVILGGGMASVADLYLDALRGAIFERAQPLAARQVKVVISKRAETVNLLGCARLAWEAARSASTSFLRKRW
jgi:glucokinase